VGVDRLLLSVTVRQFGCSLVVCDFPVDCLLSQLAAVQIEALRAVADEVRVTARTRDGTPVACPGCGVRSDWVHSRYVRHVADEAVGGRPLVIDLSVRRLYCENPSCPRTTFAEQVDGLTVRYQRRSPVLQAVVEQVARALAGKAGTRLRPTGTFQQVTTLTKPQRDLLAKLRIPVPKQVIALQPATR
jgi:nucleoid DNA-binding protein